MAQLRVSYAFASLPQEEIDNFTKGVSDNLYTEPAYAASAGPILATPIGVIPRRTGRCNQPSLHPFRQNCRLA